MADTKISGLSAVAAFATTQEFPVNDSGTSKKISGAQLAAAFPQGTLASGYAQVTADQGTFTGLTDLTSLTVSITAGTSRRLKITAKVLFSSSTGALNESAALYIAEGATILDTANIGLPLANGNYSAVAVAVLTPGSGAHTYKLQGQRTSGAGNITMRASAAYPAFILVEDIGT